MEFTEEELKLAEKILMARRGAKGGRAKTEAKNAALVKARAARERKRLERKAKLNASE